MTTRVGQGRRATALVLALVLALLTAPALTASLDLGVLGAALLVVLAAAALVRRSSLALLRPPHHHLGPDDDERHLRGAFRRQTSPDTAGRPRPRAPGAGLRPA